MVINYIRNDKDIKKKDETEINPNIIEVKKKISYY